MLQRVYATAWYSEKELNKYLKIKTKCKEQIGSSVAPALQAQQMAELKKELAKLKMDEKEKKKKAAKGWLHSKA